MMKVKNKSVPSVRPPIWLEIEYRKKLISFITKIHKSINAIIINKYKANIERITAEDNRGVPQSMHADYHARSVAEDASPADELYKVIESTFNDWEKEHEDIPKKVAEWFASKQAGYTTRSFKSVLSDAGFTVKMQMSRDIKDKLDSILLENISLISSIPQQYKLEVLGLVQRSVQMGRDLGYLTQELQHRFGVTKDRAVTIARDQNNKATSMIALAKAEEIDITEARWKHNPGSKHPRPSHVVANGKVFNIKKGLLIDGVYTFPGQEINCGCTAEMIVPEFNA